MTKRKFMTVISCSVLVTILISFQNCSNAHQEETDVSASNAIHTNDVYMHFPRGSADRPHGEVAVTDPSLYECMVLSQAVEYCSQHAQENPKLELMGSDNIAHISDCPQVAQTFAYRHCANSQ